MKTRYTQIVDVDSIASVTNDINISNIIMLAQDEELKDSSEDKVKTLLLAIDIQNDFMEDIGSLGVQGSRADVLRLTKWMYTNVSKLTDVICSLDNHSVMQIFHPAWWVDQYGNHPAPFTTVTYNDVLNTIWIPVNGNSVQSLDYLFNLEKSGNKNLIIWPYHCLEGSYGAQLETEFIKMLYFHSVARNSTPKMIYKGQNPYTEMYGIIKAEYDRDNNINTQLLESIATYDRIYIAGQASSHCVLASIKQIVEYFGKDSTIPKRLIVLQDCMSSIQGFEKSTELELEELVVNYGIQLKYSTDVIL